MDGRKDSTPGSDADRRASSIGTSAAYGTDDKGRCPSNTYPTSSHLVRSGGMGLSASGGLDWLAYSFGVQWHRARHARLIEVLDQRKETLQLTNEPEAICFLPEFGEVVLSRAGYRWGGARGQMLDYKLRIYGTEVGIAKKIETDPRNANVVVKQTGRDCLLWGGRERYQEIRNAIECLGCKIVWEKLSRADLAIDIGGLPVEALQAPYENGQFITRFRKTNSFHNRITNERTGFFAGRAPCYLTVYDKLTETKKKLSVEYFTAMIARRWNGTVPEHATRVEWQLHRSKLTGFGISSPEDLFSRQATVFAKLMTECFRITNEVVDRDNKNQQRSTLHPTWEEIANAGEAVLGGTNSDLTPIERSKVRPFTALKTARGHIKNVLYDRGIELETYEQFLELAINELAEIGYSADEVAADQDKFLADYRRGYIARGLGDAA